MFALAPLANLSHTSKNGGPLVHTATIVSPFNTIPKASTTDFVGGRAFGHSTRARTSLNAALDPEPGSELRIRTQDPDSL